MNSEGYRDPTAENAMRKANDISRIKNYLYTIRDEQKEIDELNQRIEELSYSLLPAGIRYDKDKVQTSPDDALSEKMAEITDYSNDLVDKLERLMLKRRKAQKAIDSLRDSRERQVLDLYFLSTKRLRMSEVARMMEYSEQQTYNIYKSALHHLSRTVKIVVN